ncbi:putative ribonuclease H-like domain-containing protein [Tanacetum coccineum]
MPIKLGTFDVVIGMDWLVDQDAVIVCGKKVVHIPIKNKMLVVEGDRGTSRLKIISCNKASKYIERGHQLFVAHVTEKEPKEKHLEDVPMIQDFPEVFPDDLSGLPPPRPKWNFKIELYAGAAPVTRMPRTELAPSVLKELWYGHYEVQNKEEHGKHWKIILELLKNEQLYAKFPKCNFWLESVQYLGHVINNKGVHVDPAKKNKKYEWGTEVDEAFQTLKQKLCSTPILALPEGTEDFVVYCDASHKGYGAVLMQKEKVIAYASRQLKETSVMDSGCSSHMTGNKAYLSDYEDFNGGFVAFGSDPKGGKITGKGKIKTANLDFDDVYFVDELKFNLFSVSQMCDKKNSVLFTESECLILSPSFKLLDESQVVLRAPRKDDVYSLDLKNIVPSGGITCLYENATADESKLWHRRLGYVNFKNINKLVKGHLVRGLPSKVFMNDHTCVACKKGKQHKASCKAKLERIIRKPLELLHMDLFGPVSVESINKKRYCLVVTDDFSRFSWVFFLATKDETSEILCNLIIGLEKQLNHNVKIIRCDNGTEFKNNLCYE